MSYNILGDYLSDSLEHFTDVKPDSHEEEEAATSSDSSDSHEEEEAATSSDSSDSNTTTPSPTAAEEAPRVREAKSDLAEKRHRHAVNEAIEAGIKAEREKLIRSTIQEAILKRSEERLCEKPVARNPGYWRFSGAYFTNNITKILGYVPEKMIDPSRLTQGMMKASPKMFAAYIETIENIPNCKVMVDKFSDRAKNEANILGLIEKGKLIRSTIQEAILKRSKQKSCGKVPDSEARNPGYWPLINAYFTNNITKILGYVPEKMIDPRRLTQGMMKASPKMLAAYIETIENIPNCKVMIDKFSDGAKNKANILGLIEKAKAARRMKIIAGISLLFFFLVIFYFIFINKSSDDDY
jgi:hypothetical protein